MYMKCFWVRFLLIPLLVLVVAGCATIISGRMQNLPVTSNPSGAIVTMKGTKQQTPCTLVLDRRESVYELIVEKEGYEPVTVVLKKGINGWVFGNIILGGIIGIVIDIATGSASAFKPSEVEVNFVQKKLGSPFLKNKDVLIVKLKEEMH